MSDPTLPSFRYRLEQQPPRTDCGGVVRAVSVRQFPVSKGLAGASMRLQPGCLRELHWHSTAAELGYVVSGNCRTTVLSPEGADTASLESARCVGYQFRPATNGHGRSSEGDALYRNRTTPSLVRVARSGGIASMLGRSAS